ncbi:glycerol channel [Exophiala xenobiotica]|nr:glycerol channel [Exophiala xenobiotica]
MGKQSSPEEVLLKGLSTWASVRLRFKEALAEFLGTCLEFEMVVSLQGVVAQVSLADLQFGSYLSISVVTGIAAMLGVLIAGPVSGGHLNPSVTLALVVFRRFPVKKAAMYFIGQMLGGFTGAAIVYGNYRSAIDQVEGFNVRTHRTAIIFSTYPQLFLTKTGQFFSEFLATAMLIIGIFAIVNPRSPKQVHDMAPLWVFLLILNIGAALGWETGYAMNMARDFAPRCFA